MRSKNSIKIASHPKCNLMLIAVPAPMIGTPGSSRKLVNLLEGGSAYLFGLTFGHILGIVDVMCV